MADKEEGMGVLSAFVLGGLVGAGIALLFAPSSGEETREKMGDWLASTKNKGQRFIEEKKDFLTSQKDAITAAYQAGKQVYTEKSGNAGS